MDQAALTILDWDHIYLLGWYDSKGRGYLSSWAGSNPPIDVVVRGMGAYGPPLWNAPVPTGCFAHPIPTEHTKDHMSRIAYATSIGGVYAFGWEIPVVRRTA